MIGRSQAEVLDVVRASSGTYQDSTGKTVTAAVNELRVGWRWSTTAAAWVIAGMLIEAQATNIWLQSTDLTTSQWGKAGVVAAATRVTEDATAGAHFVQQSTTQAVTIGVAKTYSFIGSEFAGSAKRYANLLATAGAALATQANADFNLATGTVSGLTGTGATAGMINMGALGWLCWLTVLPTATGVLNAYLALSNTATGVRPGYTGDGVSGLNLSEMQCEDGSVPTSRIRTTTAAATRAADVISKAVDAWFDPNSFTMLLRYFPAANPAANATVAIYHLGSSHRVTLIHTTNGTLVMELVSNGVGAGGGINLPLAIGVDNRIAFGVGQLISRMAINGAAVSGIMTTKIEGVTTRRWGNNRSSASQPNAYIMPFLAHPSGERQFDASEYPRLLSIDEMKALTA